MSDYTLPPRLTVVVGMTGSGKTTFAIRYLLNAPYVCRFVFDPTGQMAARFKRSPVSTANEVEAALATGWVIFNPHRMFPGQMEKAFRWFAKWAYDASCRGRGRKVFCADEIWQYQDRDKIPHELAMISQTGRVENLELLAITQLPSKISASITGQSTELVCFRLDESVELRKVQGLGADPVAVQNLPLGSFIAYNRLTRARFAARIF